MAARNVMWRAARTVSRMVVLAMRQPAFVDRLLDTKDDITLSSHQRAAATVGRRVSIELV